MEAVLAFLAKASAMIPDVSPAVAAMVAAVIEAGLRLVKSEKPLSLLYVVSGSIKKVGEIIAALGGLVAKLGGFLDKVLPQRVEEPKA